MSTTTGGQSIVRNHCSKCGHRTRHDLLQTAESQWEEEIDDNFTISGGDIYEMLQCCGCERICLKHKSWCSEAMPKLEVRIYPPIVSRRKPNWLHMIGDPLNFEPNFIKEILEEIYEALHANSCRLAAMGIRTLVEHIMIDKIGDHGRFSEIAKIFQERGHITSIQKDRLDTVLHFGHASVHRQYKPEPEDLRTALDIVENLIADIYVHPDRAKRLAERVPARKKLLAKKDAP